MNITRHRTRAAVSAAALASALVATACGGGGQEGGTGDPSGASATAGQAGGREGWPSKLIFAAVPAEQNEQLRESYATTIKLLEREVGLPIEFFQAADYAGVIEAMIAGRVDVAQFGPFSYVIAKGNGARIEPVAAMIQEKGAAPGYRSYGIAQADNGQVNNLSDFAGRKVCFVDPGSTSGFLYPSAGLLALGIDPEKGVQGVFAGGHDASAIAVANGGCEAGFAFDTMVDRQLIDKGQLRPGQLKVVWKSEVIAGSPVAVRTGLPESLRLAIADTFTTKVNTDYATQAGLCSASRCSFSDEGNWGYAPVDDAYYNGVREVCRLTKSARCGAAA
jgi:phosphonate transport system substrate-binding protein